MPGSHVKNLSGLRSTRMCTGVLATCCEVESAGRPSAALFEDSDLGRGIAAETVKEFLAFILCEMTARYKVEVELSAGGEFDG